MIPNYNGRKLLEANLPTIFKALQSVEVAYEFIIVDDASKDESVKFLQEKYPEIILVQNEVNLGFSPTINRGIMQATKDLVFVLNSDIQLNEDYFEPLFKYFDKEDTFGVMGRNIDFDTHQTIGTAKYPEQKSSQKIKTTIDYYIESKPPNFWTPTLFISGANALVDRKKIQELEGFEEMYAPFYGEDVDLSLRAWRLGWQCYYEHTAICKHATSSTITSHHKKRRIDLISTRNKFILHAFHLKGSSKLIWNLKVSLDFISSIFVLKFRFYKSFGMFLGLQKDLRKSKKDFRRLQQKYHSFVSIPQMVKKVQKELSKYNIKRL